MTSYLKHIIIIYCIFHIHISIYATSYPYISGDTFRNCANHILDERAKNLIPQHVKSHDIIFVKTDYIEEFFNCYHPQIAHPYILITHNSDYGIPGNCKKYLNDNKLIAWFGQNVDGYQHEKLIPIPIGIANPKWEHGKPETFSRVIAHLSKKPDDNKYLLYMNFAVSSSLSARQRLYNMFCNKSFCFVAQPKNHEQYLYEMAQFKFVLSPQGNGYDCHRTWEALLVGCIPVVPSTPLNPLYKDLPVIIVENWEDVTQEFLEQKYHEFASQSFNYDKIYAQYWINVIKSYLYK